MDDGSQAVAHALQVEPGELVLDLCAGGGGKTRLLLALGARVVAMDLEPSRLGAAKNRVQGAGPCAAVRADGLASPFLAGTFKKILLDAPCTGTGTLRRAPDVAARLSPDDVPRMCALQQDLLGHALALLAPGGSLVYATCSLLPEENEGALAVAAKDPAVRVESTRTLLPSVEGTDGFFVARLSRAP
jgi:16S rRNA (cytosine967-C5)-methyltransferase